MESNNIAIIITAYKDLENIRELLDRLKEFPVYIHIDKKSSLIKEIAKIASHKNVIFVDSTYNITWGSPSHLHAIFNLMLEASKNKDVSYIHVISGQDFPAITSDKIVELSNKFKSNIFMTCRALSEIKDKGVRARLYRRSLFPGVDSRSFLGKFVKLMERLQFLFPRKNLGNYQLNDIYKGMIWSSFPREFMDYVIENHSSGTFMKDLNRTNIAEEFFFQTIAMNSHWKDKVINNNLRYTDWSGRNGSNPSILDLSDLDKIKSSDCIFVRKIDSSISAELRVRL